jgi:hypothetical protein
MNYIKRKLNDRQGVSILFALVLLLVTIMVCTVIISASYTAAKRTNTRTDVIQETSFMDSAALQIKNQILDACEKGFTLNYDNDSKKYSFDDNAQVDSDFSKEIKELTLAYMNGENFNVSDYSFKIITEYNSNKNIINVQYGYKYVGEGENRVGQIIFELTCNESKMYVVFNITNEGNKVYWEWNTASGKGVD